MRQRKKTIGKTEVHVYFDDASVVAMLKADAKKELRSVTGMVEYIVTKHYQEATE